MAAKKSKNNNTYQAEKLLHAQQCNEHIEKNRRMFSLLGLGHLYPLLYKITIQTMVRLRESPAQILKDSNHNIPNETIRYIKQAFDNFEKTTNITLLTGHTITLREFNTTLRTIFVQCYIIDENSIGIHGQTIKDNVLQLIEDYAPIATRNNELTTLFFDDICTHISSLSHGIYFPIKSFKFNKAVVRNGNWTHFDTHKFSIVIPQRMKVKFDDQPNREVFQLGFPEPDIGVRWTQVPSSELGLAPGRNIPVYIQKHAIARLTERIGIFTESVTVFQACLSIEQHKIIPKPTQKGSFLIAYSIKDIKLGYLVASLVNEILVIRTFLFVTQSGTPEGSTIDQLTGFKRSDKEFIGMGNLKNFLSKEVVENPKVATLLKAAGCADLLLAHDIFSNKVDIKGMMATGRLITKYLEKSWRYCDIDTSEERSRESIETETSSSTSEYTERYDLLHTTSNMLPE